METLKDLVAGMPTVLPDLRPLNPDVPHAPVRKVPLNKYETEVALTNALRYFPTEFHAVLAPEFMEELTRYGHIYMYRFKPLLDMKAYPIESYPAKCKQCAAVMHCLMNNLDPKVAQFPEELVTYGGNGQVLSNWIQFRLLMHYLATMNDHQTLVMMSGHPLGLFPSTKDSPRVVITNGMMIPNYSSKELYDKFFAMNVTMYGQMTAGSYCYIGPQGIVHGTTITVMNAGRKYLNLENLAGKVFVTSGLGGMSGAQPKAAVIAGCICVVAEVSPAALNKRLVQGWLMEATTSLDTCIDKIREARKARKPLSIGYLGNVVDLWQRLAFEYSSTGELLVDLGSDQTSLHNPYNGGYYPYQVSYEKANELMVSNPEDFRILVRDSLIRQIGAIDVLAQGGMHFWDYGNGFLLECQRAGAHMYERGFTSGAKFRYPSYVQDIMGDIFSLGFGPFRWICTSGQREDLKKSDEIACQVLKLIKQTQVSEKVKVQYDDNIHWIEHAEEHKLVVGSQSRILYSDQEGRVGIAVAFNDAIRNKLISGPIVISRDHHDVSGTDSPFRETSNIEDGSAFTADMAVQNFVGDSFRGATWVALHNGLFDFSGGVGWGEVINGGFGLVLDGSEDAERRAKLMLSWDVANGVARRCWSGNENAREAIEKSMESNEDLRVTLPYPIEDPMMLVKLVSPNATPKSPRVHQKGKGNA